MSEKTRELFESQLSNALQNIVQDLLKMSYDEILLEPEYAQSAINSQWGALVADLMMRQFGVKPRRGPVAALEYQTGSWRNHEYPLVGPGTPYRAETMLPYFDKLQTRLLNSGIPTEVTISANNVFETGLGVPSKMRTGLRDALSWSGPGVEPSYWQTKVERTARTEAQTMWNSASYERMRLTGVETKIWRTMRDSDVRSSHAAMSKVAVPVEEPFVVHGSPMMFPGDPAGPPGEVYNCRCDMDSSDEELTDADIWDELHDSGKPPEQSYEDYLKELQDRYDNPLTDNPMEMLSADTFPVLRNDWYEALTPRLDRVILDHYSNVGSYLMNSQLRGTATMLAGTDQTRAVGIFDKFWEDHALTAPKGGLMVQRGVFARPGGDDWDYVSGIKDWAEGDFVSEPGWSAATLDPIVGEHFARNGTLFNIEVPEGAKFVFGHAGEREIVLPRGSVFEVVKNQGARVTLRLVPASLTAYAPGQARDSHGRFAKGGGGKSLTVLELAAERIAWFDASIGTYGFDAWDGYTGSRSHIMNSALRGTRKGPPTKRTLVEIGKFDSFWRDTSITMPEGGATVFRSIAHTGIFSTEDWKVGDHISEAGWMSGTVNEETAKDFRGVVDPEMNAMLEISVPGGTSYLPGTDYEDEVILPRGSVMQVTGIEKTHNVISMEYISDSLQAYAPGQPRDSHGRFAPSTGDSPPLTINTFQSVVNNWEERHILSDPYSETSSAWDSYTGGAFGSLNETLRGTANFTTDYEHDLISNFDKLWEKAALTIPEGGVTVFRGVRPARGFRPASWQEGDYLSEPGWVSTTLMHSETDVFVAHGGTFLEIEVPEGTKYLPGNSGEYEVILPRSGHLEILGHEGDSTFAEFTEQTTAEKELQDWENRPKPWETASV